MSPNPPPPAPTSFATRAFTPVANPVYVHNDDASFKVTPTPQHALERQQIAAKGVDPRLTAQGSVPPVAGLTPIVPTAYQTPLNVWGLYPA